MPDGVLADLTEALDVEGLPETARETLRTVYAYMHRHREHINYDIYKDLGLPLGSGMVEVSRLQCPYTDSRLLSYYWPEGLIKPCRRCRQAPIEDHRRERNFMPTPVLPPRL